MQQKIVLVVIFSILAVIIIGAGVFFVLQGNSQMNTFESVEMSEMSNYFQPTTCTITDVKHTYKTEQFRVSCGRSCSEFYIYCTDTVQYEFTLADDNATSYLSRVSQTVRNKEKLFEEVGTEDLPDLCSTGTEYQGYLNSDNDNDPMNDVIDENKLFVCDGLCANGAVVDCWTPVIAVDDVQKWANCGNGECIKLVDPNYEVIISKTNAETIMNIGFVLILGGVFFAVLSLIVYFCCCKKFDETPATEVEQTSPSPTMNL